MASISQLVLVTSNLFCNSITFQIIAKDMNGSAGYLSSDALIELTIIDVNDETPTIKPMHTGDVSWIFRSKYGQG